MQPNADFQRHWIFQGMPDRYDLAEKLIPKESEPWTLSRYTEQVRAGDFVYFWRGGRQAGLYGWGQVADVPFETTNTDDGTSWRAPVIYHERFSQPILKDDIVASDQSVKLVGLSIIRTPQGTNFKVTTQEAISLNQLIRDRSEFPPDDPIGTDSGSYPASALAPLTLSKTTSQIVGAGIVLAENRQNVFTSFALIWVLLALARSSKAPPRGTTLFFQKLFDSLEVPEDALSALESSAPVTDSMFSESHISQDALNVLESARLLAIFSIRSEEVSLRHLFAGMLLSGDEDMLLQIDEICVPAGFSLQDVVEQFTELTVSSFPNDDSTLWLSQFKRGVQERLGQIEKRRVRKEVIKGDIKGEFVEGSEPDLEPIVVKMEDSEEEVVERALAMAFSGRLVPDRPSGADLLQIKTEVAVLAHLFALCDSDQEKADEERPTFALGLFGRWGAGKSFFIEKLKGKVDELKDQGRAGNKDYYREIIQIDFNAWHYNEANIWASLVHHIFASLQKKVEEKKFSALIRQLEVSQERREDLLKLIGDKEDEREQLNTTIKEHEEQIEQKIEEQLEKIENLSIRVAGNEKARKKLLALLPEAADILGLPVGQLKKDLDKKNNNAAELLTVLKEGGIFVGRAQLVGKTILHSGFSRKFIFFAVLFFIAYFALPIWIDEPDLWNELLTEAGQMIAFASSILIWLRARLLKASHLFGQLTAIETELQKDLREEQGQKNQQLETLRVEQDRIGTDITNLTEERSLLDQEIVDLKSQLNTLGSAESLSEYINDRAKSDDYRSRLGILALIRRDFQKLSELMTGKQQDAEIDASDNIAEPLPKIDRIILYIDDLDRVQNSRKVLQVLEAVHLLLALPLFHVVVAVDERWATRSVLSHHQDFFEVENVSSSAMEKFLDGGGRQQATPREFLEKIFQISFWVRPLSPQLTEELIDGIVKSGSLTAQQEEYTAENPVEDHDEVEISQGAELSVERQPKRPEMVSVNSSVLQASAGQQSDPDGAVTGSAVDESVSGRADSTTGPSEQISFEITERELVTMRALAPVIGRSPRTVKRFILIYNLFKAMRMAPGDGSIHEFATHENLIEEQHVPIMVLLAIQVGHPDIAVRIFVELDRALDEDDTLVFGSFLQRLRDISFKKSVDKQRCKHAHKTLASVTELYGDTNQLLDLSISAFNPWLLATSRFGFQEWVPKMEVSD